uniref:Endonuclease/exonuclease/phosphatase domain-containing protein n=2 Tax=Homalodisca liturata TaxID=320908 RepID=A0A1B6HYC8_9HEMI
MDILSEILNTTHAENKSLVIMGDVNIDRLKLNSDNKIFEEELLSYGITRLPLPDTRITATSKTSIDCICTDIQHGNIDYTIVEAGISDHTGQICSLPTTLENTRRNPSSFNQKFNTENLDCFKSKLVNEDWSCVLKANDAEEAYNEFLTAVTRTLDYACPKKRIRFKHSSKPKLVYDGEVNQLKGEYLKAFYKYEMTRNPSDKDTMVSAKRKYDNKLRHIKLNSTEELINKSSNKSKALWNVINAEKQCKKKQDHLTRLEVNGNIEEDPTRIVNHLNKYFVEIADSTLKESRNQLHNPVIVTPLNSNQNSIITPITLTPTDENEVLKTIATLKPTLQYLLA